MVYLDASTLESALQLLKGRANEFFRVWLTLKAMGLAKGSPVEVDTANSEQELELLFGAGLDGGKLFYPMGHSTRFLTMQADASRSIVQTNVAKWGKRQVSTVDPTGYLAIRDRGDGRWIVSTKPNYPAGLGYGRDGFAMRDGARLQIPIVPFGVWYHRRSQIPDFTSDADASEKYLTYFTGELAKDLHLSGEELALVFTSEAPGEGELAGFTVGVQPKALTQREVRDIAMRSDALPNVPPYNQDRAEYLADLKALGLDMTATTPTTEPEKLLQRVIEGGSKAVLLYGPPRSGKTRAVMHHLDKAAQPVWIQVHDGWGYEDLILGLRPPDDTHGWRYERGVLAKAIDDGADIVVLEEVNRTELGRALGEVFTLLEPAYRGERRGITLKDRSRFWIPEDTLILMTMNTLDRSTEEVDDALYGRVSAVEFPEDADALRLMLEERGVMGVDDWVGLYEVIIEHYALGHGYFAGIGPDTDPEVYYKTRIRPVLQKHLAEYKDSDLRTIDEHFDACDFEE